MIDPKEAKLFYDALFKGVDVIELEDISLALIGAEVMGSLGKKVLVITKEYVPKNDYYDIVYTNMAAENDTYDIVVYNRISSHSCGSVFCTQSIHVGDIPEPELADEE